MGRKRKSSSLIPNHKGRVPPCRICEAPGTGFHYGVNTCEACKGFFHRSIGQHIHYKCKKANNCVIHFRTVKFCQKCRYAKCLAYGMSKTASKTGRYSSFKRTEDILELKRLERANAKLHQPETNLNTKLPAVLASEPFPAKRPCSVLQNEMDTVPDSTGLGLRGTPSGPKDSNSPVWDFSPQSDNSVLQSSSSSSSPINLSQASCELTTSNFFSALPSLSPSLSINSSRSSFDTTAQEMISLSSCQASFQTASKVWQKTDAKEKPDSTVDFLRKQSPPSLIPSPHNIDTTTHILYYSAPSLVGAHESSVSPASFSEFTSGDQSSNSLPWSHAPLPESPMQVRGIPQAMPSAKPGLSVDELTELLPLSASSTDTDANTELLPELEDIPVIDESLAEIMKELDEIYSDYDSVVRTLLEVERQTLRHKARDWSPTEVLSEQLKHREACINRTEMFGRKTFLQQSVYEEVLRETGLDADDRQGYVSRKFKCLERTIMNVAIFAKAIPGFKYIPLHQMVRLIKYARFETALLSSITLTNVNLMVAMSRSHGWVCPLDFDEDSAISFVNPSIQLMGRLQKHNLTDEEVVVALAIALVSPDRPEATNSPLIRYIHSHLVDILLKLLKQNHKEPLKVFALIVSLSTEARSFETQASSNYLKDLHNVISSELREKPFVREMITGICFEPHDSACTVQNGTGQYMTNISKRLEKIHEAHH